MASAEGKIIPQKVDLSSLRDLYQNKREPVVRSSSAGFMVYGAFCLYFAWHFRLYWISLGSRPQSKLAATSLGRCFCSLAYIWFRWWGATMLSEPELGIIGWGSWFWLAPYMSPAMRKLHVLPPLLFSFSAEDTPLVLLELYIYITPQIEGIYKYIGFLCSRTWSVKEHDWWIEAIIIYLPLEL